MNNAEIKNPFDHCGLEILNDIQWHGCQKPGISWSWPIKITTSHISKKWWSTIFILSFLDGDKRLSQILPKTSWDSRLLQHYTTPQLRKSQKATHRKRSFPFQNTKSKSYVKLCPHMSNSWTILLYYFSIVDSGGCRARLLFAISKWENWSCSQLRLKWTEWHLHFRCR